ncbi:MAG: major capsid protein [Paludibaculum sp.]
MADVFSTNVLTGVVNSLQSPPSFLLDKFFTRTQTETSEEIHFDQESDVMTLAPFVHPLVEGDVVTEPGFTTSSFKPAYVKPKTPWDPSKALKRAKGEPIGGNLSPEARMQVQVRDILMAHRSMVDRRKEWMASQVLQLGSVTVTGDKYPTRVVNYNRDAALSITLAPGAKWSDAGTNPLDQLQTWAEMMFAKSGSFPVDVVLDLKAWSLFKNNAAVIARIALQRTANTTPTLDQGAMLQIGGVLMGTVDGFNIWVYHGTYKDAAGAMQKMLPDNTALLVGDLMGTQAYGAILDEEAGIQALPFFTKSWVTPDPSRRWILTQSAPLIVPYRVNASMKIVVA